MHTYMHTYTYISTYIYHCIAPAALCKALMRFGIPTSFVKLIQNIYSNREFMVRDAGVSSRYHPQAFGIVQGAPCSHFCLSFS